MKRTKAKQIPPLAVTGLTDRRVELGDGLSVEVLRRPDGSVRAVVLECPEGCTVLRLRKGEGT
jgi:hypothetical protein